MLANRFRQTVASGAMPPPVKKNERSEASALDFSDSVSVVESFLWLVLAVQSGKTGVPVGRCEGIKHPDIKKKNLFIFFNFIISRYKCVYYRKRGSASYIVREWLLWEGERERERETPVTSIDITLKSRVIMHMITSTARRPNASTRSEPVE